MGSGPLWTRREVGASREAHGTRGRSRSGRVISQVINRAELHVRQRNVWDRCGPVSMYIHFSAGRNRNGRCGLVLRVEALLAGSAEIEAWLQ